MSNTNTATSVAQVETQEQLVARLLAENAALKANGAKVVKHRDPIGQDLSVNIGEKGGISIYGLNTRFPVSLYYAQLVRLAAAMPQIMAFAEANKSKLSIKPTPVK